MKSPFFKMLLVAFLMINTAAMAQRNADKQVNFDEKIEELFFHDFSGVPIVITGNTIAGIDAEKGTKIWEHKGKGLSLLGGIIQADAGPLYKLVPFSPYLIIGSLLVDTRDGTIMLDESSYKKIKTFEVIPELQAFIFQCTTEDKNKNKVFMVSLKSNTVVWSSDLDLKKRGTLGDVVVDKNKNVSFYLGSNLFIVDGTTGKVILNEEERIGKLFLNPSKDIVYAVEASGGGLGSVIGAAVTLDANKLVALGDKIHAFNTSDGSRAWKKPLKLDEGYIFHQEVDGKVFIKHEKAGSLYDYKTGEKLWKKDFEKRRISLVEKVSEGYMIHYGSRKMLVDEVGKKVWKKAQYRGNEFLAELGEDDLYDEFRYNKGSIIATNYKVAYYEIGVKKPIWKIRVDDDSRLAYDASEKKVILLDGKRLYILNPDKGAEAGFVNQKLELKKHRDFNTLEVRDGNYFLSSPWEYAIVGKDDSVKKTQYYQQPGEAGRKWLNALSVVGELAGTAYSAVGIANIAEGAASGGVEEVTGMRVPGSGGYDQADKGVNQLVAGHYTSMASQALYDPNRFNASSSTKDYAFFFTKNEEGVKYLVQVAKDDGVEKDKFIFENNKPNYHVDEVAKRVFYTKGKVLNVFDYK